MASDGLQPNSELCETGLVRQKDPFLQECIGNDSWDLLMLSIFNGVLNKQLLQWGVYNECTSHKEPNLWRGLESRDLPALAPSHWK